jgi:hypothetical protein
MARQGGSSPEITILVANRSGVWNVKVNGKFYGDYVRREWAIEAAQEKQREIMISGGCARVAWA